MMNNLNIKETPQNNMNSIFGPSSSNSFEGFNTNYDFEETNNNFKTPNSFADYYGNIGKDFGNGFNQDKSYFNLYNQSNIQKE